ncbi:hypothetical protein ACFQ73_02265 [Amycolatopsis japonica]|uniref:hypothetical protein n=1 Tax=Amycolatopsis japonica TaxID=208439 RepID=UPI00366D75E6
MRLGFRRSRSRTGFRAVALIAALAGALTSTVIAPSAAQAAVYYYKPSHPMMLSTSMPNCTGGWGIRSSLNIPYFLTAGHCFNVGDIVYGLTSRFGFAEHTWRNNVDSAVIRPDAVVDGWQEIPGIGLTVGKVGDGYAINAGNGLAMQGVTSGLIYGTTFSGWWLDQDGRRYACGSYPSKNGDSGAPVFAHNEHGVYAIGVHVGLLGSKACYVTIDDLLRTWTATLPVFPPQAAKAGVKEPTILLRPEHDPAAESAPRHQAGELIAQ